MKIYGLKSLLLLAAGVTILTAIVQTAEMLWVSLGVLAFWILIGIPIIKIGNGKIVLQSLTPFRKTTSFTLADIIKLEYYVGNEAANKITIVTPNGTYKSRFSLSWWETRSLYKHLVALGVKIESKGPNAFNWNP